jgi:hypothetical protein
MEFNFIGGVTDAFNHIAAARRADSPHYFNWAL